MAKRTNHTIGLDIGTSKVTCIVGAPSDEGVLQVLGVGEAESRGLRKGVIVNPDAAVETIKRSVEDAERMSGVQAEEVTINLAGSHIMGFNGQAIVAVAGRASDIRGALRHRRPVLASRGDARRIQCHHRRGRCTGA